MNASCSRLALAVALCALLLAADKGDDSRVELRVVSYADMGKVIKDLKGKIVIVDFWQDT